MSPDIKGEKHTTQAISFNMNVKYIYSSFYPFVERIFFCPSGLLGSNFYLNYALM